MESRTAIRRRLTSRLGSERGAAAVEFALVVPVLLLLLFGIIEFGRVYNAQIELTGAAREGARVMAIGNDPAAARAAAKAGAPSLNPALTDAQLAVVTTGTDPSSCLKAAGAANVSVTVTARYPLTFLTGMFGNTVSITGKAVMQCGG
ncbi:TadE/TadG family type IV pilus assembly protein [Arthrobacter dokdonensis]|uniref:TadE/TadG family type IV pilus assembly protein n=1 Tax=Arthrobacter dokdonellae TaxID=2211210 RepID=UPI000DE59A00|nr:TadE family protein [Arthrobacter dokdonellae]